MGKWRCDLCKRNDAHGRTSLLCRDCADTIKRLIWIERRKFEEECAAKNIAVPQINDKDLLLGRLDKKKAEEMEAEMKSKAAKAGESE